MKMHSHHVHLPAKRKYIGDTSQVTFTNVQSQDLTYASECSACKDTSKTELPTLSNKSALRVQQYTSTPYEDLTFSTLKSVGCSAPRIEDDRTTPTNINGKKSREGRKQQIDQSHA